MPESQPETSLSDYDKEWDLTEAPVNQGAATEDDRQTDDEDPAPSESAPESTESGTPTDPEGTPAEGPTSGADGTDTSDVQEALRRAETETLSLQGQLKAANDRLAIRGRKLKELEQELAELKAASRQPTQFEKEFPEYAEDIRKLVGIDEQEAAPPEDPVEAQAATVDAILAAHPDAGQLWADPALHEYLATDPVFVYEGTPMYLNSAINSDNAAEVNAALTFYKSTRPASPVAPEDTGLEDMVPPPTSGGKPSIPSATPKTPAEEYEAAWADDDDI